MESKSYEIYKEKVGGITFTGDKMKELSELPEKIQNAWKAIDDYYKELYDTVDYYGTCEGYDCDNRENQQLVSLSCYNFCKTCAYNIGRYATKNNY